MKKIYTLISLLIISVSSLSAQNYFGLEDVDLSDAESCRKAEPKVIEVSEYLLSTPCVENVKALTATAFIIDWMDKTEDYTFTLGDGLFDIITSDISLTGRYFAALAKTAIEMEEENADKLLLDATTLFLEYCENPKNKVKVKRKLKKYIDAKNNGTLQKMIKK